MKLIYQSTSFVLFICLSCQLYSQQSLGRQLENQLEGTETLSEVMSIVEAFYDDQAQEIKDHGGDGLAKFKHWKRWEWYMEGRLGPNGEFVNVNERIYKEILAKEKANGRSQNRSAIEGDWSNIGIEDSPNIPNLAFASGGGRGRIDRIAFHPSDPNTFYVATPAGGLWKTTDGGATWEAKSDYIASIGVSGVVVDRYNANTIYILTGTADNSTNSFVTQFGYRKASIGVLKSTDGGDTWSTTGNVPVPANTNYYGFSIVQNEAFSNNFVICTTEGIYETINGGTSWFKTKDGKHYDIKFKDNGTGDIAYTVDDTGVYYSNNFGNLGSWNEATFNIPPGENKRKSIALAPNNNNLVYVLAGGSTSNGVFAGLYRSNDSGQSYTRQSNTPNIFSGGLSGADNIDQASYDNTIAVHPTDSTRIVTGGVNIWGSTNSGASMSPVTKWFETQGGGAGIPFVHADHHMVVFNPLDNKLYSCHDGGLDVSTNNGSTWTNISKGIDVSQFYHASQNPAKSYQLLGGLQDNGTKIREKANGVYRHASMGDGFDGDFSVDTSIIYNGVNRSVGRINIATASYTDISPTNNFYPVILAHPTDPNIVFCGTNSIFKSTNQGTGWSNRGASGSWSMAFAPSLPTRMYAAGSTSYNAGGAGRALYTSTDTGDGWTNISNGNGFPPLDNWQKITDIAIHQTVPDDVYVTFGGFNASTKVYFSTDGGANWLNHTYNLPNVPVNCIATADGKVYVGTDIGIYRRNIGQSTWVDISDNLPNTIITEIFVDQDLGNLKVTTFGRGVWQLDFCVNNISLTAKQEGDLTYKCNNILTATSIIPGNDDNNVNLRAGNYVDLKSGFISGENSTMIASTAVCDNPSMPLQTGGGTDQVIERYEEIEKHSVTEKNN